MAFLLSLPESKYDAYIKKLYKFRTGRELNLKKPKLFTEKIQWLKLYDNLPIKTQLTDKVLVRDWVKEKIGEEYLKPVLWIGESFDEIPFYVCPERFIIKCNHGCKWHFKINNKEKLLQNKKLIRVLKQRFEGWLNDTFYVYAGLEMQYKNITPQILIEQLLTDEEHPHPIEYEIYCFNGSSEIFQKVEYSLETQVGIYDKDFNPYKIVLLYVLFYN